MRGIGPIPQPSHAVRQLDLLAGKAERDRGLARVEENSTDFLEWARGFARSYAGIVGFVSMDDVREAQGWRKPHHPNVYGAIFNRSEWECVGRRPSKIPSNHAREIKIWRLKHD